MTSDTTDDTATPPQSSPAQEPSPSPAADAASSLPTPSAAPAAPTESPIPFTLWAQIRNYHKTWHAGMLAFTKRKLGTVQEWDDEFKNY